IGKLNVKKDDLIDNILARQENESSSTIENQSAESSQDAGKKGKRRRIAPPATELPFNVEEKESIPSENTEQKSAPKARKTQNQEDLPIQETSTNKEKISSGQPANKSINNDDSSKEDRKSTRLNSSHVKIS